MLEIHTQLTEKLKSNDEAVQPNVRFAEQFHAMQLHIPKPGIF